MPDHDEQRQLKNGLLRMGNLPSAPADPVPAISRRINRRRKVRYTVSGIALAACAALVATAVVPAFGGRNQTISPAATGDPTAEPTSSESPAPSRSSVPPGSIGSAEWNEGLPIGSQVRGVGFEDFVAGKQGPAHVVKSSGAWVVVSHRENGTGKPCLTAISQFSDVRPRFCLDRGLSGTQVEQKRVDLFLGGATAQLLLVFTGGGTHDVELVSTAGDQISRENVVRTKTSDDARFFVGDIDDELGPAFGQLYAHAAAADPSEGITPPKGEGRSSVLRAEGGGFEDFVAGKQGVGYDLSTFAMPGVAVSHRLNGTGQPCLTIAQLAEPQRVCFTGWRAGQRIQPTIRPLADGRVLVAGFAKLDVARVDVVGQDGKVTSSPDTVATPTTRELAFFAYAFDRSETDPVEVRVGK